MAEQMERLKEWYREKEGEFRDWLKADPRNPKIAIIVPCLSISLLIWLCYWWFTRPRL